MNTRLLRPEETAEHLSISKSFLYQLVRMGRLNAVRIRTAVRFRPEDLEEFIAENMTRDDVSHPTHIL